MYSGGHYLSPITTNNNENLFDATRTPRGNIEYTAIFFNNKVVMVSEW